MAIHPDFILVFSFMNFRSTYDVAMKKYTIINWSEKKMSYELTELIYLSNNSANVSNIWLHMGKIENAQLYLIFRQLQQENP